MITLEELKKEKQELLIARFNQFRDKCNGDWKPNFKDDEIKYYLAEHAYDSEGMKFYTSIFFNSYPKFGYFKNQQDCQRAIELFGDEIKELF